MIQGQLPEPVFSPDFTADGASIAASISVTGVECFLIHGGFDASSLARSLFATGTSTDGESEVHNIDYALDSGVSRGKLRRCFQQGNHLVLICADTKADARQAASYLVSLFNVDETAPEVMLFDGEDGISSALAAAAAISGSYDSVRLLCLETHRDKSSSSTGYECGSSFLSISVSSITSVDPASEVLAIISPVDLLSASATDKRGFAESDLRHHGYPWSAVSLVVTSARTADSVVTALAEKFLDEDQTAEDAYQNLTGMPCSKGAPKTLLDTRTLAERTNIQSTTFQELLALGCVSLALYQKILPKSGDKTPSTTVYKGLVQELAARPWIHPVSPVEPLQPRRAILLYSDGRGIGLEEASQGTEGEFQSYLGKWDSELFLFSGTDTMTLIASMTAWRNALLAEPSGELASFSALINRSVGIEDHQAERAGIIASSLFELVQKLEEAIEALTSDLANPHCDERAAKASESHRRARGIYLAQAAFSPEREPGNSIAFILPGLGAAYPDMLLDLCFYFPQVRQVFDFVDRMALKSGDQFAPSRLIFPSRGGNSNTALLAMMDSAVVTVILAEWAFYRMLRDFNIYPDSILGCSTGEFASLAMNGCVDILEAAGTFYRLSTEVARSVPLSSLANLRSICAAADWKKIEPLARTTSETVYLGAEMGPSYSIISGPRAAIDELSKSLDRAKIDYYPLPVAIPYHTPLVAGKVSTDQSEVQQLDMRSPELPTWTCSDSSLLPNEPEQLRQWSVGLFEKPIQFRATLERMHESGARIFVEVGPKGSLVPLVSECLSGRSHLAVPVNVANRSGITQIHHMLATLFCAGVNVNTAPLYSNRRIASCELRTENQLQFADDYQFHCQGESDYDWQSYESEAPHNPAAGDDDTSPVLASFLSTLQDFHTRMLLTQELVITEYLQSNEDEPDELPAEVFEAADRFAFVNDTDFDIRTSCFNLVLDTAQHMFLLDHAIGGATRSAVTERVYLVPLMVTLEILAEAACIFLPGNVVTAIRNVRAYKRVKVDSAPIELKVRIRSCDAETGVVVAELVSPDEQIYVQAEVWTGAQYGASVAAIVPGEDVRPSGFACDRLYGPGSMFHGPTMQSVESLRTGTKYQDGMIRSNDYEGWFVENEQPTLAIDPLLLDNASQLVLYHLYEAGIDATALLPFHIDSIDFYDDLSAHRGALLHGRTKLHSVSKRGTLADIEILDAGGTMLCQVSSINSRAIMLPPALQDFVANPAEHFLSKSVEGFSTSTRRIVAQLSSDDLSIDQTALHWLSDYILNAEDLQYAPAQRSGMERRHREWILGRIVVKDAVRQLLWSTYNLLICPADICIVRIESGAPLVVIPGLPDSIPVPQVSISHKDDLAVAVASLSGSSVGIDVETVVVRDKGFEEVAFTAAETALLNSLPLDRATSQTIFWTVKEAAAKAGGSGLQKVDHIQITQLSLSDNRASVTDTLANCEYVVHFKQFANFIIALL